MTVRRAQDALAAARVLQAADEAPVTSGGPLDTRALRLAGSPADIRYLPPRDAGSTAEPAAWSPRTTRCA